MSDGRPGLRRPRRPRHRPRAGGPRRGRRRPRHDAAAPADADGRRRRGRSPCCDRRRDRLRDRRGQPHRPHPPRARAGGAHRHRRVVYASSNHAVGFTPRTPMVPVDTLMRPDTFYGVGKAAARRCAACTTTVTGSASPASASAASATARRPAATCPRGCRPVTASGSSTPACVHPTSGSPSSTASPATPAAWWDLGPARSLGYQPLDDAEQLGRRDRGHATVGRRRAGRTSRRRRLRPANLTADGPVGSHAATAVRLRPAGAPPRAPPAPRPAACAPPAGTSPPPRPACCRPP